MDNSVEIEVKVVEFGNARGSYELASEGVPFGEPSEEFGNT